MSIVHDVLTPILVELLILLFVTGINKLNDDQRILVTTLAIFFLFFPIIILNQPIYAECSEAADFWLKIVVSINM